MEVPTNKSINKFHIIIDFKDFMSLSETIFLVINTTLTSDNLKDV